jgi:hypothetical protein
MAQTVASEKDERSGATLSGVDGRLLLALLAAAVAALCLRLPGLFSDFWLDEIWTLEIARELRSPLELFTEVRHSNNHHLNTLVYYLLYGAFDDPSHWSAYRIHSLLAGVGSVFLAISIALRVGRLEAFLSGLLTTGSYLLIHFSSEGRGYALVIFFALASYWTLQRFAERARVSSAASFWLLACLGFLSHLLYLHVFIALGAWLALLLAKRGRPKPSTLLQLGQCFAVPSAFLAWFYLFDIRRTKIGEGPEYALLEVLTKAGSYAGGGPAAGPTALAAAVLSAGLALAAVFWLRRRGRDEWLFYLVVIFASPALVLSLMRPDVMFVRYFLLSTVFGLIVSSFLLAEMWRRGGGFRLAACALLLLYLVGNGANLTRFYRHGRGDYLEALRFIADHTSTGRPIVSSDQHFRNRTLVLYYNRFLPAGKQLAYVKQSRFAEWLLYHRIGELGEVLPALGQRANRRYRLVKVFPYSDLSGWHWILYRKEPSPAEP